MADWRGRQKSPVEKMQGRITALMAEARQARRNFDWQRMDGCIRKAREIMRDIKKMLRKGNN